VALDPGVSVEGGRRIPAWVRIEAPKISPRTIRSSDEVKRSSATVEPAIRSACRVATASARAVYSARRSSTRPTAPSMSPIVRTDSRQSCPAPALRYATVGAMRLSCAYASSTRWTLPMTRSGRSAATRSRSS
jgi:hypothetical protein